jgi:hypothetical protein
LGIGLAVAKHGTEARARQGGIGVTHIPLSAITGVHFVRTADGRDAIEVDTVSGRHPRLGVRFDEWGPPIRDAIVATGRQTADIAGGFRVS